MSFKKGDSFAVVESVKAASDIFTPVSGEVMEINRTLEDHPEYINHSPYGDGWLVKFRITDASELDDLMNSGVYQEYVRQEDSRL